MTRVLKTSVVLVLLSLYVVAGWTGWLLSERSHLRELLVERAQLEMLVADRVAIINPAAPADEIARAVLKSAARHHVDPLLVLSVIETESYYDPRARGRAGERGLMQITEGTAKTLGLDWEGAFMVDANIDAGTRYLAKHLRDRVTTGALARYNGGSREYAAAVIQRYRAMGDEKAPKSH